MQKERIRYPIAAGLYYPEDKAEMLDYIRIRGLERNKGGYARAIIAPHGAWSFSGELAVNAFSMAAGRTVKRVIIMGPIHDSREKGLFLSNSHSFSTPLGKILVDNEITEELEFHGNFLEINDIPHLGEHSIEVLLPFIKYCFPCASIVPILMGQPGVELINDLAISLRTVIGPVIDETLLIVSCNLSTDCDKDHAKYLAEESLRLFSGHDSAMLIHAILDKKINACGGALVASLLNSGLLQGSIGNYSNDGILSAESAEKDTVYYGALSFD